MKQQGMTLIEIIVALSVFSILSVMTFSGLNTVFNTQRLLNDKKQYISGLQYAFKFMQQDFSQVLPKTIRGQHGSYQSMFSSDGNRTLNFTYSGGRNPANLKKSKLLRVAYEFDGQKLIRHYWPQLDGFDEKQSNKFLLANEIGSIEWQFLKHNNEWSNQWPPINVELQDIGIPRAVLMNIYSERYGDVNRIFMLPQ